MAALSSLGTVRLCRVLMGGLVACRRSVDDSGASAVEFALVLPLLLLVVFGIINFGVVFSQQLTLNNAVRSGARSGVVVGQLLDCPAIRSKVSGDLSGLAMDPAIASARVTLLTASGSVVTTPCSGAFLLLSDQTTGAGVYPCAGSAPGTSVVVDGQYPSSLPVSFPPFPTTLPLSAKAVYVCEFG
ncbi:MAG: pilus assembly protein [Actinomycetales bacterium]|nr:pilus assembly protein [Actinomycetales bacterium]